MPTRRTFLKNAGLATIPFVIDLKQTLAAPESADQPNPDLVNFIFDGDWNSTNPEFYSKQLLAYTKDSKDTADFYGGGGAVQALEQEFASITGKEKAIFVPSGTMSNQLAIKILSGPNPKIFVQETSHVYRDEADAAQSVHNKRLIPLAKGAANFTLEDLKESIEYHDQGEVFKSGIGAVSIENPVRRMDGQLFKFDEIKRISSFCRENNYKLHLDGARLHIASSYSGMSIKEYAACFDTVYISLYKYLGSAGGAILCGEAKVIEQMPHLIKIYGGNMFQSWPYALPALNNLKTIDNRLRDTKIRGEEFAKLINQTAEFQLTKHAEGTNVSELTIQGTIDYKKFFEGLKEKGILIGRPNKGAVKFLTNETLLRKEASQIIKAMQEAFSKAKTN